MIHWILNRIQKKRKKEEKRKHEEERKKEKEKKAERKERKKCCYLSRRQKVSMGPNIITEDMFICDALI